MELMQANRQWSSRPDDERFTSIAAMQTHFNDMRLCSSQRTVAVKDIECRATDDRGLALRGPSGHDVIPTNWSFGQLATLAKSPRGYLSELPAPLAADCVNYGLRFRRQGDREAADVDDIGILLHRAPGAHTELRAATGPTYGRIWNSDIIDTIASRCDLTKWKVPGEFGKDVPVTKANTTLYASDRDMFVFLADEHNRIELPNRRNGRTGSLARGFFCWNSEVGKTTFGLGTFLFDYVCCNRIVWGAEGYQEIKLRHTSGAPDKYLGEVMPALENYSRSSAQGITDTVKAAQAAKLGKGKYVDQDVADFLRSRQYGKGTIEAIKSIHMVEEGRPIETLWDTATGITAYARSRPWQDDRVALERDAGAIIALAA